MNATSTPAALPAALYLVGTPIGNLEDVTIRAIETLRHADAVFAEDTRITRRLLDRYEIRTPLFSCHRFNERARTDGIIERIRGGQAVALTTDSGMPAVSDPGARLAAACRAAGLAVIACPGPSAVTTAMALCGFESTGFHFAGFLPPKSGARRRNLERLLEESVPVVIFESPFRVLRLLGEMAELAPERRIFIGRELTKRFEETIAGTAAELLSAFADRKPRGEFVLVIEPGDGRQGNSTTCREGEKPSVSPR